MLNFVRHSGAQERKVNKQCVISLENMKVEGIPFADYRSKVEGKSTKLASLSGRNQF
jgi:hypothetical protein